MPYLAWKIAEKPIFPGIGENFHFLSTEFPFLSTEFPFSEHRILAVYLEHHGIFECKMCFF